MQNGEHAVVIAAVEDNEYLSMATVDLVDSNWNIDWCVCRELEDYGDPYNTWYVWEIDPAEKDYYEDLEEEDLIEIIKQKIANNEIKPYDIWGRLNIKGDEHPIVATPKDYRSGTDPNIIPDEQKIFNMADICVNSDNQQEALTESKISYNLSDTLVENYLDSSEAEIGSAEQISVEKTPFGNVFDAIIPEVDEED